MATPTTLIALLKAIAYGWQQAAVAREAKEISKLGTELHERIGVVMDHFNKLGKSLDQSVAQFNSTARSLESRLTVTAKKFEALDSASGTKVSASQQIGRLANPSSKIPMPENYDNEDAPIEIPIDGTLDLPISPASGRRISSRLYSTLSRAGDLPITHHSRQRDWYTANTRPCYTQKRAPSN